jgi:hypothetical protein
MECPREWREDQKKNEEEAAREAEETEEGDEKIL